MAALSKQLDRRTKIPSQLNVRMTKDILAGSRRQLLLSFRLPFLFISFRILPSPSPTSHLCNNLLSREVLQMAADHSSDSHIFPYFSSCIAILLYLSTSSYSQYVLHVPSYPLMSVSMSNCPVMPHAHAVTVKHKAQRKCHTECVWRESASW